MAEKKKGWTSIRSACCLTTALDELITWPALFFPRLLSALGLLLIGWLVGRLAAGILRRLAKSLGLERKLASAGLPQAFELAGLKVEVSDMLVRLVFWLILLAFGLPATGTLGLQGAAGLAIDRSSRRQ